MNKFFLSLAVVSVGILSAQVDFSETRYGITAGGNYSGVRNAHNPSGKRIGFQAGGLAVIPIDKDNQFFIQPEILYHQVGETGYNKSERHSTKNSKYHNDYISVPLYFKAFFSEAESEFFALAGPKFNFLVKQTVTEPSLPGYHIDYVGKGDGKAAFFNFAVGLGLGFSYKRQWELALKYDYGVSNTYPNLKYYEQEIAEKRGRKLDPNTLKNKSEQAISITLSYIFD